METTTTKTRKNICFAYFADGKFIGWYADSAGSIRENSPKIYGHSEEQISVITENFRYKLSKLSTPSVLADYVGLPGLGLLDNSLNADKTNLSQYNDIQLKITECPHYDGPNPNFDKEKYAEWLNAEKAMNGDNFRYSNCPKELENWIYADYNKVKEWASIEPTKFIGIITK